MHFTFIELPKFTPHSIADKRMMVLWLRFLTEINSNTKDIPADLLNDPEIGKAVEDLEVSGFTDAELRAYDKFWDSVSVERTLLDDRYQKGMEEGMEKASMRPTQKQHNVCWQWDFLPNRFPKLPSYLWKSLRI